jgi:hypothetical protein
LLKVYNEPRTTEWTGTNFNWKSNCTLLGYTKICGNMCSIMSKQRFQNKSFKKPKNYVDNINISFLFLWDFLFCAMSWHSYCTLYTWSRHDMFFYICIQSLLIHTCPKSCSTGVPKMFWGNQDFNIVVFIFLTSDTMTALSLILLRCGVSIVPCLFNIDQRALIPGSHICRRPRNPKRQFCFWVLLSSRLSAFVW